MDFTAEKNYDIYGVYLKTKITHFFSNRGK